MMEMTIWQALIKTFALLEQKGYPVTRFHNMWPSPFVHTQKINCEEVLGPEYISISIGQAS